MAHQLIQKLKLESARVERGQVLNSSKNKKAKIFYSFLNPKSAQFLLEMKFRNILIPFELQHQNDKIDYLTI